MKKFTLSIACLLLGVMSLQAQNDWTKKSREEVAGKIKKDDSDTSSRVWRKGMNLNVNINQGSLTNWAAGGDKFSFSIGSNVYAWAFYKNGRRSWDNVADLAFGYINTTSLGGRKSDDRIDLTSKYGYEIGKKWYVSGLVNLRTQFANGYLYPNDTTKTLSSKFFSPAYILVSPGFDYKPDNSFSLFLSPVTSRFVLVMDKFLASQGAYGVDTGKHFRYEIGAYLSANYVKTFAKNMSYKGRLDLFSDYRHNPQNVDIFFTNALELKVNKWISALLTLDMIYDDDVKVFENKETGVMGPRLQVKQVIGVGFAAKF
ncbi:Protein of unknown function [Chitinophaga terrae (ex Kim and Jung 2007)]|jgi:hypothetical protein|uniref:DUF3078 domain-containing protein n=1 Tax=Chitinophaga terrae (ex Kim and Jung 2007) TaxID=408074 RepID=A0A1H4CNW2_9BACT|nr:DUF3078 domain-containing protein [Chitinophaga terrae (ex Kim and Jung 2007)]MDQ0105151.1 hypothetical protein [Chitinophaga terrae (ex Kim and Jung 2007)]GEP90341.1 hypothetical protein CTE07_19860 [Chitinophaga terrae (ex Kim and Jung 2007)]SEA61772.1 Protein of unknown function [Chitinophaga terrae (ex Kim and Jung 2007)]